MASTLLQCSICPKLPRFSDLSHLLTHVGSKGHLSHLHKLQVRSHQEIAAGHQLATYNHWYQQHGLGQLLSERMQQKEARNAIKRERRNPKPHETLKGHTDIPAYQPLDPALVSAAATTYIIPKRPQATTPRHLKRCSTSDNDSDYQSTPVKKNRKYKLRKNPKSPPVSTSHQFPRSSDVDCPAENEAGQVTTPDNTKLKGVVWPGMQLFDAATTEMKRKRNQRKDGSVLKKMQKMSNMIVPTEIIYSPCGQILRERYIDGEVDETDLLPGETPIAKSSIPHRRQALADTDGNVPRINRRPIKSRKSRNSTSDKRNPTPILLPPFPPMPGSSTQTSFEALSHFSPTEDESTDFKLTVSNLTNRTRHGNFAIFNNSNNSGPSIMSVSHSNLDATMRNPLMPQGNLNQRPQLSFVTTPWLQPQYQQNLYYNNGYITYQTEETRPKVSPGVGLGKENTPWLATNVNPENKIPINPLVWKHPAYMQTMPYLTSAYASHCGLDDIGGRYGTLDDPFGCGRNPLSVAVGQLDGSQESSPAAEKPHLISPNGTLSEHGANDYEQAVFGTSE